MEEEVKKSTRNNRSAGHRFERLCVNWCKEHGFEKAVSSRMESRSRDNAKVDICYTEPFNIQCKSMASKLDYEVVLDEMPNEENNFNVIFHRKLKKANKTFKTVEDLAVMKVSDY